MYQANLNAIIVDDEPAAIDVLKTYAELLAADISIVATASNGIEALRLVSQWKPQLLFLDIDMPLLNGLELVEKLRDKHLAIIFTTGSSAHAFKAIKLEAVDYLLKPIDPSDFALAVEKARTKIQHLFHLQPLQGPPRLQLPTQQGIHFIDPAQIMYITGKGSYAQIFLSEGGETLTVSKNIGQLEKMLSAPYFFRCHHSRIVNLQFVKSFINRDGLWVLLKNGSQVEVSRRSKEALLARLGAR